MKPSLGKPSSRIRSEEITTKISSQIGAHELLLEVHSLGFRERPCRCLAGRRWCVVSAGL